MNNALKFGSVLSQGVIHCRSYYRATRLPCGYLRVITEKPKPINTKGSDYVKSSMFPEKAYMTWGLEAPKTPNGTTWTFIKKINDERYKWLPEEERYTRLDWENRSHQGYSGIPYPGFAQAAARALLRLYDPAFDKITKELDNYFNQPYTHIGRGNMTYSIEHGKNITASEGVIAVEEMLRMNNITILSDNIYGFIAAIQKLFDLDTVKLKIYGKNGAWNVDEISHEAFVQRSFTHNSFNKNHEKGQKEARNIACISNIYRPLQNVIEGFAMIMEKCIPNQIGSMGGQMAEDRIRGILNNEKVFRYEKIISGSEDKTGWNRQQQVAIAAEIVKICCERLPKKYADVITHCMKATKRCWVTMKPFRVYSPDLKQYRNIDFTDLTWEMLTPKWKSIFYNDPNCLIYWQKNCIQCRGVDGLVTLVEIPPCMFMGVWTHISNLVRGAADALFQELSRAYFRWRHVNKGRRMIEGSGDMVYTSDDSTTIYSGNTYDDILEIINLKYTWDLFLCMKTSSKKTNLVGNDSLLGALAEFCTVWWIRGKKVRPGTAVLAQMKLSGGAFWESMKQQYRMPAQIAQESSVVLALVAGMSVIENLAALSSFHPLYPSELNPRFRNLTRRGLYGCSVLHGAVGKMDLVSSCVDPLYREALKGRAEDWTINIGDLNVTPVHLDAMPINVRNPAQENDDQTNRGSIYNAPCVGTQKSYKEELGSQLDIKKKTKKNALELLDAINFIAPITAFMQNQNSSPLDLLLVNLVELKETTQNAEIHHAIDMTEKILRARKDQMSNNYIEGLNKRKRGRDDAGPPRVVRAVREEGEVSTDGERSDSDEDEDGDVQMS